MSTAAPLQNTAAESRQFSNPSNAGLLLQRKCACGGSAGLSDQCDECQAKKPPGLQTKLAVSKPGDVFEQEADRIAEQVMAASAHSAGSGAPPRIQRFSGQSNKQMEAAPSSVHHALGNPGRPLEPALRQEMEQRFGHDFSRVRVHSDEAAEQSARNMNAHAYTVGHDIVFSEGRFVPGTHEGQRLLAHELTHVVQQRGGRGGSGAHPFHISPSGQCIARQPTPGQKSPRNYGKMLTDWLLPAPVSPPSPKSPRNVAGKRVLDVRTSDRPRRTRVTVAITGHASPRWSSAHSGLQADKLNQELSQKREKAVRDRVEQLLRDALPDQQLVFEYAQRTSIDADPFDVRATVGVESGAVGSQQTLQEAGKAARSANAPSMRRVDLSISLSSAIDTIQSTKIQERRQVSGATRDWAIKMGVTAQVEAGVGGGVFNFMLKNRKTGQEVEGWAEYGLGGLGASVPIPTIDMGDYENFSTKEPANFSDFDFKRFTIGSAGFNALLFGYEWSSMSIWGLPGGNVDDIDVGGFVMGGAGIDIGSGKFGMLWLKGKPPDTYPADVVRDERKFFTSQMTEEKRHRVLFETDQANISADQEKILRYFVNSVVENYQRGGVYSP